MKPLVFSLLLTICATASPVPVIFDSDMASDCDDVGAFAVYRQALAPAPDASVVICSVGALSNLEDLLRSRPDDRSPLSGIELVRAKVKNTVIMGGGFPRTATPETNIKPDPAAAVTVVNDWPKKHAYVKIKGDPAKLTRIIEDLMKTPPKPKRPNP